MTASHPPEMAPMLNSNRGDVLYKYPVDCPVCHTQKLTKEKGCPFYVSINSMGEKTLQMPLCGVQIMQQNPHPWELTLTQMPHPWGTRYKFSEDF